jgi:hypothetical protein
VKGVLLLESANEILPRFSAISVHLDEVSYRRFSCDAVEHLKYSTIFSPSISFAILYPFFILRNIFSFGFPTYSFLYMKIYELLQFCCVNTVSRFLINSLLPFIHSATILKFFPVSCKCDEYNLYPSHVGHIILMRITTIQALNKTLVSGNLSKEISKF